MGVTWFKKIKYNVKIVFFIPHCKWESQDNFLPQIYTF